MFSRIIIRHLSNQSKRKTSVVASQNHCNVVLSKDETCFVAHHPEVEYPYEFTRPIKSTATTTHDAAEELLKVNSHNMITKSPNLEQLQSLTYTPYRYWHEYIGRQKRLKYKEYFNDNVDRKGLTS